VKQLLIDAGNTRLKWATLRGRRLGRLQVVEWNGRTVARVARQAVTGGVDRVLVCSVAGTVLERALRQAARAAGAPAPQFIRSTRRAAGVRNGYVEPWRLGADRWVAMLGARARHPGRALCIVDVGTALTIDLLDSAGQHRGGLITPGPALMVESLLRDTARRRPLRRCSAERRALRPQYPRRTPVRKRAGLRGSHRTIAPRGARRTGRPAAIAPGRRRRGAGGPIPPRRARTCRCAGDRGTGDARRAQFPLELC